MLEQSTPAPKKVIVVLGAHRSGTSLCAAGIECLGADLCLAANGSSEENPKGFFENTDVVGFNDRLFGFLGGAWDNPLFSYCESIAGKNIENWLDEAVELFRNTYGGKETVAIKDPRLCQLLPFWLIVFARAGVAKGDVSFIHILRDPIDVAYSQFIRGGKSPEFYELGNVMYEGAALWFSCVGHAIKYSRGYENLFLTYEGFIAAPLDSLIKQAKFLHLSVHNKRVDEFCSNFVDKKLQRSAATDEMRQDVFSRLPQARELYNMLLPAVDTNQVSEGIALKALELLDSREARENIFSIFIPSISRLSKLLRGGRARQREEINRMLAAHGQELEEAIAAIKATSSWRLTLPLRAVKSVLIKLSAKASLLPRLSYQFAHRCYSLLSVRLPKIAAVIKFFWKRYKAVRFRLSRKLNKRTDAMLYQSQLLGLNNPLVSVIVPNFNHARFLERRLDSIFSQSYKNIEVILMDDCSTDNSPDLLRRYYEKYPGKTKLLLNNKNSGGVFHQWEKGLAAATGELVWVAESDDWCSDNFLDALVPFFRNEAMQLAFSKTSFVDGASEKQIWSMEEYLESLGGVNWGQGFVDTGHNVVSSAFSIKNIIPNVSSAIFRNPQDLEIIHDEQWKAMRTCGDWVLYLHLIRGGMIAYSVAAVNYYRIHGSNTSVKSYSEDVFYLEHEIVANTARSFFDVSRESLEIQKQNLIAHWKQTRPLSPIHLLDNCYCIDRIEETGNSSKPNILMAGYAFSAGGGETFPIQLANLLKRGGYNVTFLDFNQETRNEGIRSKLRSDIAVVSCIYDLEEIVSDFGIDVIHSHHASADMAILNLLGEDAPCKTVVSLHGMYETIPENRLRAILPLLLKRTGAFVYTADKNLTSIIDHGLFSEEGFTKIGNALDVYHINKINLEDYGIPGGSFVLCNVSRAIPEKGWKESVEATRRAREISGKDIHLILIGEGPEYDQFQKEGSPAFVHLLGFRSNIRDFFAASDAGLLPSKFRGESFPLVLIDCLHSGTPMLASSVGEIPAMLEANGGIAGAILSLNNWELPIEEFAKEISRMASDTEYFEGLRRLAPLAAKKFSTQEMCAQYDKVYMELARKNKPLGDVL
jgi:glycosyltransferase involved in cell wall biosynthesis